MTAIETIAAVIASESILFPEMIVIPTRGATEDEIAEEERLTGRQFSRQLRSLLSKWNGATLDVVRLYGCGPGTGDIDRISERQLSGCHETGFVVIGSDAAGFVYMEDPKGAVYSMDTESGTTKSLAVDLDDFFSRHVFGPDAVEFAGEEWANELRAAGLIAGDH